MAAPREAGGARSAWRHLVAWIALLFGLFPILFLISAAINPLGTLTAEDQKEAVVRLGSAKGGWWRQVGWRHLIAWVALFFGLFPILFLISAAINPLGTLSTSTLIPKGASLENFSKLFASTEYLNWYWNTMVIALIAGTLSMFISACAAYAYSRFRFRGRRMGLLSLLLIQMFPQFLAIVTLYLMFTTITDYYPRIGFNTRGR